MNKRTICILLISFLITFNLKAQPDTLFGDFLKLFPKSKIEAKFLVKFLEYDPENLEMQLNYQKITARKIIRETPDYIIVAIDMHCGAGGICEKTTLYSLRPTGKLISKVTYSGGMGDCGFMNTEEPILMNDSILIVHAKKWEGSCNEGTTESESSTVYEYKIENGRFSETRRQNVVPKRKYLSVSTELLGEMDIEKLSKDELAEMRNELFASYGYKFKTEKWADYFLSMDWYKPTRDAVPEQELTIVERINLEKIRKAEKN